ncbi:MAG TPA: hypothetical protein VEQ59_02120 [Polyangiaceae bacterium]|nr:hypothetical protein [Polyangiaceae bacterium]
MQPQTLPPCAPGTATLDWESYLTTLDDGDQFAHPRRSFSGRLWLQDGAFSSLVSCAPGVCCNGVRRSFVLADSPHALVLEGPGLGCGGDESRECCALPADGQSVIATGDLNNSIPLRSARNVRDRWHLLNAQLCLVSDR